MSLISGSVKDILSIKLKTRHDGVSDQFNRILMVKMLIICSLITSVEFFNDKVSCIVPNFTQMSDDFVHSACWIRGFYIYKELINRTTDIGYYGMPKDVTIDGIADGGQLCRMKITSGSAVKNCRRMTKMYYVQYQYFPFYIASLAIMYYIPYILFRVINADIFRLHSCVKTAVTEIEIMKIADTFFDRSGNGGILVLRLKVIATMAIKLLYVVINFVALYFTDSLLNHRYLTYGFDWIRWSSHNNSVAFDYVDLRHTPKPGNYLLPAMGYCDITEGSKAVQQTNFNDYKIVCEISTHIFYQYVLLILWFLFVIGIILSCSGFLLSLCETMWMAFVNQVMPPVILKNYKHEISTVSEMLTVRELEYMKYIRYKNFSLYKALNSRLQKTSV